jgi:hypothetical protein
MATGHPTTGGDPMTRPTGILSMVELAAAAARKGERDYFEVPHYSASVEPSAHSETGDAESLLVLRHYGTPILYVRIDRAGPIESWLGVGWWGSATDCSAIAKAHRALGMRKHIKRGALVPDAPDGWAPAPVVAAMIAADWTPAEPERCDDEEE